MWHVVLPERQPYKFGKGAPAISDSSHWFPAGVARRDILLRCSAAPEQLLILGSKGIPGKTGGTLDLPRACVYLVFFDSTSPVFLSRAVHLVISLLAFASGEFPRDCDTWPCTEAHEFASSQFEPLTFNPPPCLPEDESLCVEVLTSAVVSSACEPTSFHAFL